VLGPDGTAVVIAPLVAADPALPSGIAAYALPDGRELWRCRLPARRGRAVLGDLDGDGRPELVVGTGDGVHAYDPWTGEVRLQLAGAGLPVAIGDPFASGFLHLVTVTGDGIELWRGRPCRPGAMQWAGQRGDLWRTGTVDAGGTPVGPL
jgi:outer membrane protein assembly factor BamB